MIRIAPSILSADFCRLGAEVTEIEAAGADWLHVDVMDGLFVPNISVGFPVIQSLHRNTGMFLDTHLMIEKPLRYAARFCETGSDLVNLHVEADTEEHIGKALVVIREHGKKTGVTLKPGTPAEAVLPFLETADLVLVMTVEPGFGGQRFMADQLPKITRVREYIDRLNPACALEVDGGVDENTAPLCVAAGADVLVAGNAVFGRADRAGAVRAIREICEKA